MLCPLFSGMIEDYSFQVVEMPYRIDITPEIQIDIMMDWD